MKRIALVLLTFAAMSSILYAQQKRLSKAAIEVRGTKLRLGMTKAEVTDKLAGTEVTKIHDNEWIAGSLEHLGPTLQFTDGSLTFADREWTTGYNDLGEALFGVVNSLNSEGFSSCSIRADTHSSPDIIAQRVWINCGEKTIVLIRRSMTGKTYTSVMEQLGTMRDVKE
jgi:hypothetical protein